MTQTFLKTILRTLISLGRQFYVIMDDKIIFPLTEFMTGFQLKWKWHFKKITES